MNKKTFFLQRPRSDLHMWTAGWLSVLVK